MEKSLIVNPQNSSCLFHPKIHSGLVVMGIKIKEIDFEGKRKALWFQKKIFTDKKYKKRFLRLKNIFYNDDFEEILVEKVDHQKKEACKKALEKFLVKDIANFISEKITSQKISTPILESQGELFTEPPMIIENVITVLSILSPRNLILGFLCTRKFESPFFKNKGLRNHKGNSHYEYRLLEPVTKTFYAEDILPKNLSRGEILYIYKSFCPKTPAFEIREKIFSLEAWSCHYHKITRGDTVYYFWGKD